MVDFRHLCSKHMNLNVGCLNCYTLQHRTHGDTLVNDRAAQLELQSQLATLVPAKLSSSVPADYTPVARTSAQLTRPGPGVNYPGPRAVSMMHSSGGTNVPSFNAPSRRKPGPHTGPMPTARSSTSAKLLDVNVDAALRRTSHNTGPGPRLNRTLTRTSSQCDRQPLSDTVVAMDRRTNARDALGLELAAMPVPVPVMALQDQGGVPKGFKVVVDIHALRANDRDRTPMFHQNNPFSLESLGPPPVCEVHGKHRPIPCNRKGFSSVIARLFGCVKPDH